MTEIGFADDIDLTKLDWFKELHDVSEIPLDEDNSDDDGFDIDVDAIMEEQERDAAQPPPPTPSSPPADEQSTKSRKRKRKHSQVKQSPFALEEQDKYFLVPWDIKLPSCVRQQPYRRIEYQAFRRTSNNKLQHHLRAINVPLSWIRSQVEDLFSVFGQIARIVCVSEFDESRGRKDKGNVYTADLRELDGLFPVSRLKNPYWICFRSELPITRALQFESESVVQRKIVGRRSLGLSKYLREYCASRPENLLELRKNVDEFMFEYDKLQNKKLQKIRSQPRRNRGFVRIRESGGWQTVHYPNSYARKKSKATVVRDTSTLDQTDSRLFDRKRVRKYHKQTKQRLKRPRSKIEMRNAQLQRNRQYWSSDMSKTTKLRSNRRSLK